MGCFVFILFVISIAALVLAQRANRRAVDLGHDVELLRGILNSLLDERAGVRPAAPEEKRASEPAPRPFEKPAPAAEAPPVFTPPVAETPAHIPPPPPVELPRPIPEPPPPVTRTTAENVADAIGVSSDKKIPPSPKPPPPPPAAPRSQPSPRPPARRFNWEGLVGVKLFSWIAGIAFALAAVFFLKHAVDYGWLSPPIRMTIGLLFGIGLLIGCELKVARNFPVTANSLDGAGIAILYSTLFASHALWKLLPAAAVFLLMVVVTGVAVLLSIRRDSVFIALLGLLGGFATPALISTGEDRAISLFSYLLLLNCGLAWIAYRKRWPVLSVLSLLFTALYQWGWVAKFLDESKFPIAIAIFLVFGATGVIAQWLATRGSKVDGPRTFERTAAVGAVLPLLFAIYGAAIPGYGSRFTLLFFFLFLLDAGLAIVAASRRGPSILHALGATSTVIVFLIWISFSYVPAAWPTILAWIAGFILFYAAFPLILARFGRDLQGGGGHAQLAAPILFFVFAALAGIESRAADPAALFATEFVLIAIIAAIAIRTLKGWLYLIAALLGVVTQVVWSANHLTPERLTAALLVYGSFSLLFLAVPNVARRYGRELEPKSGMAVLILSSIAVLFFLAGGAVASVALIGLAVLLFVLNIGALQHAANSRNWILAIAASILSWIVLGVWWSSAASAALLIPALTVIALFALMIFGTNLWLARGREGGEAKRASDASYFGLAAFLFLFVAAGETSFAIPPWPILTTLGILTLASGVAALYGREPALFTTAVVAAEVVLITWEATANVAPWPAVGIISTLLVSLLAAGLYLASSIRGSEIQSRFETALATALLMSHLVAIIAAELRGTPSFGLVLFTHVALVVSLLVLVTRTGQHALSSLSVALTAIAFFLWRGDSYRADRWSEEMTLATVLYLSFIVYPLALGARARKFREPYVSAILASAAYFFFARTSLVWRGYENVIGLLPVVQALLMLLLIVQLLRIEPPGERTLGRLALVAAAALAFVTVAIPLQLDKEWITIGWALEAAALVWLFGRIPHRGLLAWSGALFAAVFVRLVFNPAVLTYHPRSDVAIWNWYLYTYVVPAAAFYGAARFTLIRDGKDKLPSRLRAAYASCGTILLFLVLNIEIADFYAKGPALTFNFNAGLGQDLTYTLAWALFAIAMLVAGIILDSRAARIASLVLLLVSIVKCFLHDLMRLGGLYRVASLVGLAISLAAVAILLQKFVMQRDVEAVPETESP